jgi:predicted O-methyltransferase YrrM
MSLQPLKHIEAQNPALPRLRRKLMNRLLIWGGVSVLGGVLLLPVGLALPPVIIGWLLLDSIITLYERNQLENFHHYRQIEALTSLHRLVDIRYPLPPMRLWVISPDFAALLAGTIKQHQPKTIVEFGSGTSTIITSYCLESLGTGHLTSFEHQAEFVETTQRRLHQHDLTDYADVIHAPLDQLTIGDEDGDEGDENWQWYATDALANLTEIDLLIIDGPPKDTHRLARYPTMPVLYDQLADGALILIDDYMRKDEFTLVNRWLDEFDLEVVERIANEKGAIILKKTSVAPENEKLTNLSTVIEKPTDNQPATPTE